jgi:SfnB family sulfur acquisition oxidoreductase
MATVQFTPEHLAGPEEALAAAAQVGVAVAEDAVDRDRHQTPPLESLGLIAASGLLGIAVPKEHCGAGMSASTVTEVFRLIARADPSVAQLLLAHFVLQDTLAELPVDHPTASRMFADILAGAQLGNATAERGTKHGWQHRTRATPDPAGGWRFNGRKYYATGALGARWIAVAGLFEEGHPVVGFVDPESEGLTMALEDWSSFGQRCTFSGTVLLDGVHVPDELLLDRGPVDPDPGPSLHGAYDQVIHAAIDVGIARAALEDGAKFVRTRARPWREAEQDTAAEEPHVIRRFGELKVRLDALEAMLERAARTIDIAREAPALTDENTAEASLAVAGVKALSQELAVEIASGVLELAGTSATDQRHGLDRHWRNVRVHTLHDPARWKYVHIGNEFLNGVRPPRSELL